MFLGCHRFSDIAFPSFVFQRELILKDLLENGRLTLKQIIEGAESSKSQGEPFINVLLKFLLQFKVKWEHCD